MIAQLSYKRDFFGHFIFDTSENMIIETVFECLHIFISETSEEMQMAKLNCIN